MIGPEQSGAHEKPRIQPITVQRDGKITQVPLKRITELFGSISSYNEQFSMGTMVGRSFASLFDAQEAPGASLRADRREQQLTAAQVSLEHDPTLAAMGLSLEPAVGKQGGIKVLEEQAGMSELRINVSDHVQFTHFLQAVQPEHIQAAPVSSYLGIVAQSLAQQLLDNYNLQDPSSEALQLFGGMGEIIGEYRRLGIPAKRLETYYMHVQKKDLREFLLVERYGLLWKQGEYFGPADWQQDATAEQLRARWNRALQTVSFMAENPNAAELREQVLAHLQHCADLAFANLQTLPSSSYSDEEKAGLRSVLLDAQLILAAS